MFKAFSANPYIQPLEGMSYDRGKMSWGMMEYGLKDPDDVDRWEEDGKGKAVKLLQDGLILPDILGTCKFMMYAGITPRHWNNILCAITGWDMSSSELLKVGERVANLQRMFNVREGFTREQDQLPDRILELPEFGKYKDEPDCVISDINKMLNEYYAARDWDKISGRPTNAKLEELGIVEKKEWIP